MNLIVVESPTKARTLGRFLGEDYRVESTMGHIKDLPKSKLGVDIEHDFAPEYVLVGKKKKTVETVRQLGSQAAKIFIATDPDREGEAIAYHVSELFDGKSRLARIVFHEITETAVKEALANPRQVDMQLVDAQTARRVLDRLVGYKLSPLLWRKVRRGLSAGRVQTVAVRLIVEREREIGAFRPQEYWEIWVEVIPKRRVTRDGGPQGRGPSVVTWRNGPGADERQDPSAFLVKLIQINGEKAEVKNKKEADGVVGDLEKANYSVASVEKREVRKYPAPPFTTSTMTQAAARRFFWSAKQTMRVAQKLYEEGLITYHRTDSTNLAMQAIFSARGFIEKEYGAEFLPEKPRFYKTKSRVAQEAHEAIRPTNVGVTSSEERVMSLGRDAATLYGIIWKRFVACQMTDAIFEETTINVAAITNNQQPTTKYLLQAVGQTMKFAGWMKVYEKKEEQGTSDESKEISLPEVKQGEELKLLKVDPRQLFTEPPPRYTEASLIKTLEKLGIGRPSTYAPTISTIQERQYVEKAEGKFTPTPVGEAVNDFLLLHFPDVFDYQFTARMEDDLDEIANGKAKWVGVIREFWQPFSGKLETVSEKAERVKIAVEETGEACPKCKIGKQVIRVGRFGKFLSCSRFPDCDWKGNFMQKTGQVCPECQKGEVIVRKTRKGRRFYGCSRYPDCKWASWRKPAR